MKILVTNANSRMALCITRALKKKGHDVVVADYIKNSMCFFSNKKSDYFIYPSPYSDPDGFISFILEKVKTLNIDVVFPVHEETFLLSKRKSEVEKHVGLAVPDYEPFLTVHNKDKLYDALIQQSIKTPKTLYLKDFSDYNEIKMKLPGKVVLKPRQGGGNWGIFFPDPVFCYNEQIKPYLKDLNVDIARVLVQEWIPTQEKYSHVVIYQNGQFIQDFADIHVRDFPLSGGSGVLRKTCDASPMTEISKHLFDDIGWHGMAEVEYVSHAETGEFYLIEINPRVWGGVNSAITSSLDIVGMYLDIAVGKRAMPGCYKTDVQTRWFWGDMRVFPEYFNKSKSKFGAAGHYLHLLIDKTKTDEFYWDDPMPFFAWPCHTLYKMFKNRGFQPVAYDSLTGEWD
ncbi:ATP-grasp domain-containing protein [Pelovirga terrestris]|uniref:ATP-grasp domain-containing protein n=1 Tax=Pelovirga terrestris TaxID=2771352 RepID=A0A8J6UQN5_9BACT|nr:ATP-grasp domain-containing protein [Pelovirga terrestris]MBD1399346.1 ATP-grasp domain-containing protein [Pelovirga terrestris]